MCDFLCEHPDNQHALAVRPILNAAKAYAAQGAYVFPLHSPIVKDGEVAGCTCEHAKVTGYNGARQPQPDFVCSQPGKHPKIKNWEERATVDPDQIFKWFGRLWSIDKDRHGNDIKIIPNIGIACGKSGILALDADSYKDAYTGMAELGLDEECPTQISGGGGNHYIYRLAQDDNYNNSSNGLSDGIDIRAHGGLIVAAPSLHGSGNRYQWEMGYSIEEIEAPPIPESLRKTLDTNITTYCTDDWDGDADDSVEFLQTIIDVHRITGHWNTRTRAYTLDDCPFSSEHSDGAYVGVVASGALYAGCHHSTCKAKGWQDFKEIYPMTESATPTATTSSNEREAITGDLEQHDGDKEGMRTWAIDNVKTLAGHSEADREALYVRIGATAGETWADRTLRRLVKLNGKEKAEDTFNNGGNPFVVVNNKQLSALVDETVNVIHNSNKSAQYPHAFVRGAIPCRVTQDENKSYYIQPVRVQELTSIMCRVSDWFKRHETKTGVRYVGISPPMDIASGVLSDANYSNFFPALTAIVNCPIFTKAGIHKEFGYDEETQIFNSSSLDIDDIEPTAENLAWANEIIFDNILVDFLFDTDASRAHAICLLFQPFVRFLIDGPTPNYDVEASTRGTGKGLLVNALTYAALGEDIAASTLPDDEAEVKKTLLAKLMAGTSHVFFDNINHAVDSATYAAVLTQPVFSQRILGVSQEAKVPINQTWISTANNPVVSDEIARRWVRIRLDSNMERPDQRDGFKHENLMRWIKQNRPDIVRAVLIQLSQWDALGRPTYTGSRKNGSYEGWVSTMGGILESLGIPGFLENQDEMLETAMLETSQVKLLVLDWYERHGTNAVSIDQLFTLASYRDGMVFDDETETYIKVVGQDREKCPVTPPCHNLLADMLGSGKEQARKTKLGQVLTTHKDKVISGFRITKATKRSRKPYRLSITNEAEAKRAVQPASTVVNDYEDLE